MSIEYIVVCGRINYYHNRSSKVHILELNHVCNNYSLNDVNHIVCFMIVRYNAGEDHGLLKQHTDIY